MERIQRFRKIQILITSIITSIALSLFCQTLMAEVNALRDIQIHPLPGNKVQVDFCFACPTCAPKGFSVDNPSSVVLDFPGVANRLSKDMTHQAIEVGVIKGINVVESNGRTRAMINVRQVVPFETEAQDNKIRLTLQGGIDSNIFDVEKCDDCSAHYQIGAVDFKRGEHGEGKIIVRLSTTRAPIDFKEENGKLVAYFVGAQLPECMARKYDVSDFGTPAQYFVVESRGDMVKLEVNLAGDYDKIAYQMDNMFIIETRHISREERQALKDQAGHYTGERLSLNFQDIDIRAVLQILADFAGFNLVTSDSVKGNVTIRLQNVPWDQAMDIILKTKGLDKRQTGNVVLIGPAIELAKRDTDELEIQQQIDALGTLRSELIQINYAKAEDLAKMLKDKTNSLLTLRGNVTADVRTNTLLIQDTDRKLTELKVLLRKLDRPVRQVEISTQIITSDDFVEQTLGIRFGGASNAGVGHRRLGIGADLDRARAIADFPGAVTPPSNAVIGQGHLTGAAVGPTVANSEGLFSDLFATPTTAGVIQTARWGFALARLPNGTLLDLEIQALEFENRTRTIARPKIVTTDKTKAWVETGTQIPYNSASSSGATAVEFKEALLRLEVTPQITPDGRVIMDLVISNDSQGTTVPTGIGVGTAVSINTNALSTQVLVDNGETIVLGGILQLIENKTRGKVPILGDIPILGNIFRNKYMKDEKKELLIFITPKIIEKVDELN